MWFVNMYKNKIMKMGQLLKIYVKNKRPKYRHVFFCLIKYNIFFWRKREIHLFLASERITSLQTCSHRYLGER